MRDGVLEKRSSGLLQLWKKKRCVLTEDGLRLHRHQAHNDAPAPALSSKAKDLPFAHMATVDCVEYKRGLVYFTVVLTSGKEIDFRCAQEGTAWNAEIALALVRYKNLQAVLTGRNKHLSTALLDTDQENVALWTGTKMRVWFLLGGDTATRKQPYRSKIKGFSSNMLLNAPFGYDAWYINGYHPYYGVKQILLSESFVSLKWITFILMRKQSFNKNQISDPDWSLWYLRWLLK